ncbi:MAG: hypothetical protein HXS46_16800 [Theionarchaea archaeon]|nr:MAG: hypothetical protein AYK18_13275 [Theionarchaea archaeon DG-70]MBU7012342.1 hypothetical protein [Theionarchaea archaeon]
MAIEVRRPEVTAWQFITTIGTIIVFYLIISGRRITPSAGFFSMSFWLLFLVLWLLAPRATPFLWLFSIPAGIVQWIGYVLFGCIIAPRATWGFIILWYFPAGDRILGIILLVVGLLIDIAEDAFITNSVQIVERTEVSYPSL